MSLSELRESVMDREAWHAAVHGWSRIHLPMQEMRVRSLGWEASLEKEMVTHSSILAGKSHGQRSLVGCSPRGTRKRIRHILASKQQ